MVGRRDSAAWIHAEGSPQATFTLNCEVSGRGLALSWATRSASRNPGLRPLERRLFRGALGSILVCGGGWERRRGEEYLKVDKF